MGSFLSKNHGICTEGILVLIVCIVVKNTFHSEMSGQKTFTMPQDKVNVHIKCPIAMIVLLKCYYPSVLKTDVLASRRISLR